MTTLWARVNSFMLLLLVLMGIAIIAMLAVRTEGGPLDPSGAPGSTLPQVEPRRPIPPADWSGTFPIVINEPGSYFLTRNIIGVDGQHGISIESRNVTLDLNGFQMSPSGITPSTGIIVTAAATRGVEIRNGSLYAWSTGIDALASAGARISNVRITFSPSGIRADDGSVIEDCTLSQSGGVGIIITSGVVRRCTIFGHGQEGIRVEGGSLIEDNLVYDNGTNAPATWSQIRVAGVLNYIRDNVVLTPVNGAPSFRITGQNNHFLRNYYRCGYILGEAGNFFPAAVDLVDTNYC